jgi:pantoate--beta-alanine ligase
MTDWHLSSRNVYLSAAKRAAAPRLYAALYRCAREIKGGMIETARATARETVAAAGFVADYFEARHAETLHPIASHSEGPLWLLAAARLIDNIAV